MQLLLSCYCDVGLVLLSNGDYLMHQPTLTAQLFVSDFLALVQIYYLLQFAPAQEYSTGLLITADVINRVSQCFKLSLIGAISLGIGTRHEGLRNGLRGRVKAPQRLPAEEVGPSNLPEYQSYLLAEKIRLHQCQHKDTSPQGPPPFL